MVDAPRPPGFCPAVPHDPEFDATRAEQSFPAAFRAIVAEHGDRVAVVDAIHSTTYAELDARSDAVATALSAAEVDTPIVVVAGHDASTVTAMVGIAKAGRLYAVVDGAAPDAYQRDVVARLGARVVITDVAHRVRASALDSEATTIVVDELASADYDPDPITPQTALSISFTSGSSGTPKAVVHSHRNVVHNALRVRAAFELGTEDRFLAAASFQYTASATVVYSALLAGAAIFPYDFSTRGTEAFSDDARSVGLTVVQLTPALSGGLAKHAGRAGVPSVRLVSVGGDRLDLRQVHELHTAFPAATVVHRFNTSETNWVAGAVIDPKQCARDGRAPVGWPVPWLRVSVRDQRGDELPAGQVGELWVHSEFLALGYLGDDERTAACFLDTDQGRVDATGDRVRQHADGLLEFVGRDDATVKIRGVLVDPTFVERAIEQLDGVRTAAVMSCTSDGRTGLAAFVVLEGDTSIDVRRAVASTLPRGMVPATVTALDELPTTVRGKVDTAALQALLDATPAGAPTASADALERAIAARFGEVLGVDGVGTDDDFFALGGDSLSTIELATALTLDHGAAPELSTLLEHPTPASLAGWIRDATPQRRDLVRLGTGSDERLRVVFFAGTGGTDLHKIQPLATSLRDRTSFVVVPRGFERREAPDRTIPNKARRAVDALLELDPSARFALVGRSSGGVVALEAATQLSALGREPPLVVLLDSNCPSARSLQRVRAEIAEERSDDRTRTRTNDVLRYARRAAVTEGRSAYRRWTAGVIRRTGPSQMRVFRAVMRTALVHHRIRPYAGRTVLLRARNRNQAAPTTEPRDLGWGRHLTGSFTIVDVPGGHTSMLDDAHLPALVAALEAAMAEDDAQMGRTRDPRRNSSCM